MLINEINSLDEAIIHFKKSPLPLKVVDGSEAFNYLNAHTDGVVGYNHIFYNISFRTFLIYYTLSDDAKFTILEIREVD